MPPLRSRSKRFLRGLRPAVLGPLRFSVDTGHLRSALLCQAVDRSGAPLLWMTYPAIEFLRGLDWRGRRVLEWGAGNSTLWWARMGAQVVSIEHSQEWIAAVRAELAPGAAITLRLARDAREYTELARDGAPYDLSVIDGEHRFRCAEAALAVTAPTGGILLDNAEQRWSEPGQSGFPILDLLQRHGWRRIDFYGFAPAVARPHCTSLFLRPETTLLEGQRPPALPDGIVPG